jgi:hypothetical protein
MVEYTPVPGAPRSIWVRPYPAEPAERNSSSSSVLVTATRKSLAQAVGTSPMASTSSSALIVAAGLRMPRAPRLSYMAHQMG